MKSVPSPLIALVWRGDPAARAAPTHYEARLKPVADALRDAGFTPVSHVYFDDDATALADVLARVGGALVWINPVADGRGRGTVDALLRQGAAKGVWVSAHPDIIARMGVKTVLHATRTLGWGVDTDLYASPDELAAGLPAKLRRGPRVLKPERGNDGRGVLKAEYATDGRVRLREALSDTVEVLDPAALADRLAPCFADGACMVDQEFLPAGDGMVRCYMSGARVIGFGVQAPRASGAEAFAMNSAKAMQAANCADFADLRTLMETDWTPGLMRLLAIAEHELPALWDADFLWRPQPADVRFALCEINASCVSPFPDDAPAAIAALARTRLEL